MVRPSSHQTDTSKSRLLIFLTMMTAGVFLSCYFLDSTQVVTGINPFALVFVRSV